jgi:hypothetical protein
MRDPHIIPFIVSILLTKAFPYPLSICKDRVQPRTLARLLVRVNITYLGRIRFMPILGPQ